MMTLPRLTIFRSPAPSWRAGIHRHPGVPIDVFIQAQHWVISLVWERAASPSEGFCGCCGCGHLEEADTWCGPCLGHIGSPGKPPWERTYQAVFNEPCPLQVWQ